MPNSTERVVTIKGDAEALQIASYTIASMVGLEDEAANMPPQILYDPGFRLSSGMPMMAPPMMGGGGGPASSRGGDWRGGRDDYRPNRSQQHPHHQQSYGAPAPGANRMQPGGYPMIMDPSTMTADQKAAMNAYYLQMQQMQMMLAQNPQMAQQYQQYYAQMMTGMTGGGGQIMAPGRPGGSMGGAGGGGNYVTDEMRVPHEYVGKIIGRGGANTKEIKFRTGSDIKINDHADGEADRVCVIYGTAEVGLYMID